MSDIAILNTLTGTTFDSVEGYRKAMAKAESPALKQALAFPFGSARENA